MIARTDEIYSLKMVKELTLKASQLLKDCEEDSPVFKAETFLTSARALLTEILNKKQ